MKSIVLLIDSLKGGGAERVTLTLAQTFIEQNYDVSIVMMQNIVAFEVDSAIDLYSLDFTKGMLSSLSYREYAHKLNHLLEEIEKKRGDTVFIGGSLGLTHRLMHLANLSKAYYFIHGSTSVAKLGQRSGLKRQIKMEKIRKLYHDKKLICVSDGVKEDILQLGITPESIYTIYNPFDYGAIEKMSCIPIDFELPKAPFIVHVGRFSALKRHDLLLTAFSRLKDTSYKLVLVGVGEEEQSVKNLALELGIKDRVVFAGFQSNPYPIIKAASLLVLSSDHEGLPTVIIEALSLHTPVVSTDCPSGPSEIMGYTLRQYLVPVGDSVALSSAMAVALESEYPFNEAVLRPFEKDAVVLNYQRLFKSESKRILLVIDSLRIGGAERVTLTLAKAFVSLGYGVDIIIIDAETKLEVPSSVRLMSINFQRCPASYLKYSTKLQQKIRSLQKENGANYSLILVHLQKAIRLMRTFSHPHIYFCIHTIISLSNLSTREGFRRELKIKRLQKIYNGLNLITVSGGIKKDLLREIDVHPKSIHTIYNPIDRFSLNDSAQEEDAYRYEGDYVVHVGRLTASKRHDRLLQIYKESGIEAKLLIVGDGEQYHEIEQEIKRLGLSDRVRMCGFITNPYALIQNAKVLLLTSDYEGFAIVLVEALMLGTPVISTNCPSGPAEIMKDELKKYLIDSDDISQFSKVLNEVAQTGYTIPNKLLERFESHKIAQDYLSLMRDDIQS